MISLNHRLMNLEREHAQECGRKAASNKSTFRDYQRKSLIRCSYYAQFVADELGYSRRGILKQSEQ